MSVRAANFGSQSLPPPPEPGLTLADVTCLATIMPSGTTERAEDVGWVINRTWGYAGAPLSFTAGSSAAKRGSRLDRIWRDISMLHTHAGFAVFLVAKAQRELVKAGFNINDIEEEPR